MNAESCIACLDKMGLVSVHEELTFDGYTCRTSSAAVLVHQCFNIEIMKIRVLYAMCSACLTKLLQSCSLKEQIQHNLNSLQDDEASKNEKMKVEFRTEQVNVGYTSDDCDDIDCDNLPLSTYWKSNGTSSEAQEKNMFEVSEKNTKSSKRSLKICDYLITKKEKNQISDKDYKTIAKQMSLNGIVMKKKRVSKSTIFCESLQEGNHLTSGNTLKARTCQEFSTKFLTSKQRDSKSLTFMESNTSKSFTLKESDTSKSLISIESNTPKFLTSLESTTNTKEYTISESHSLSFNEKMQNEFKFLRRDAVDFYMFSWYNSKYHCSVCEQKFGDVDDFKTHTRLHSMEDTDFFFHSTNFNTKRKILKVDISSMKCKYCEENVTQPEKFRSHLYLKHNIESKDIFCIITPYNLNKNEMKCVVCCKVFFNIMMLTRHMNEHYANFICSECGTPFLTAHRLSSHKRSKHVTGVFKCKNHCDQTFETSVKRNTHMRTVRSGRWSLCPLCPERLTNFYAKMAHLAKVHNEEIKKYKCEICPQRYVTAGALKSHVRKVHLNERNHVCALCGAAFFSKVYLRDHMVKHNGEKTFHCEVCDKSFSRKSSLRIHKWVHKSYKRFVCQSCGRGFAQNGTLKTHMKVHSRPRTRRKVEKNN